MFTKLLACRGCSVLCTFSRISHVDSLSVATFRRNLTAGCQVAWSKKKSAGIDGAVKNPTTENAGSSDAASKVEIDSIFLLAMDDKPMGNMSYEQAVKVAQKKNLKLVKIEDPVRRMKSDVYKLMSGLQLHEVRVKLRDERKGPEAVAERNDKAMFVTSKISEHDLNVKTKTIRRFIASGHIVRVTINSDGKSESAMETLYKTMEKIAVEGGGQALQKRISSDLKTMKFSLQPVSKKKLVLGKSAVVAESTDAAEEIPKDDSAKS